MLRFRVPASTTNLGHGFDCLGIALGAANTISVEPAATAMVSAPGAPDDGLQRMATTVREACAKRWDMTLPGFTVRVGGDVPVARGMGSSSTIFLGVAAACQHLAGRPFAKQELLEIAAAEEGHPDNAAAACMGGFTIVAATLQGLRWSRFAVPNDLVAVIAIPPFEVKTSEARRILPQQVERADLVRGLQRSALITAILASGRITELAGLFEDAWHERYRATVNPGLIEARAAAQKVGAIGTILSGSGSTVLSFSQRTKAPAVASAVLASYRVRGVAAEVRTLEFDNAGLEAV
ncbi:MAG TPA: homoserine kinase [Planctomycetota bacterium]|nr:homoserine kinase [Planctomycetota bacterium]